MMNAEEFPVVLFSSQDGDVRVNAVLRDRTLWLTQKSMAGLFGVKSQAITKHLKNIYATGELQIAATCSKMEQVQSEGGRRVAREMVFYNLDAIIAVGYRVNSYLATQFRIWATKVLTEYITKGFVLDDNRLKKGGNPFGEDYFRELLERVRSIRASERRIWQQITDIYAECSIDYDRNAPTTRDFYAMVQTNSTTRLPERQRQKSYIPGRMPQRSTWGSRHGRTRRTGESSRAMYPLRRTICLQNRSKNLRVP